MTPYQKYRRKWEDCQRCPLASQRRRIVLAGGKVPCDLLVIGEAPGASEDALGKPFVGPAGKLLDYILDQAGASEVKVALTNLVACYPREQKQLGVNEPPEESIKACAPRLIEFASLCQPKGILLVGKLSRKHVPWEIVEKRLWDDIIHPAAILRADVSQRGLAIQRSIVAVRDLLEEMME